MAVSVLSVVFASLGVTLLGVTNLLRASIPDRWQRAAILGAIAALALSVVLGTLSRDTAEGSIGLALGLIGGGVCGTGYLLFGGAPTRTGVIRNPVRLIGPADDEESDGLPVALRDDAGPDRDDASGLPSGPVRRDPPPACVVRHLSGFEFIHARLSGRDWRKSFSVNVFVYVRDGGRRMDFYIDGTGSVWWGVTSSTKTVKLGKDELYGLVRCIDGCTKILWDPFGTPSVTDDPLIASFRIETQMVGADTLYVHVTAAAGMDGQLSIGSAIPGAPSVSATESGTQVSLLLGANAFKCVREEADTGASKAA